MARSNTQNHVFFEDTVYIQTPLNQLPEGSAIFFEFRHWKPKKQKVGRGDAGHRWGLVRLGACSYGSERGVSCGFQDELGCIPSPARSCLVMYVPGSSVLHLHMLLQKSCKAYCFMEMDEIKSGPVTLEIYKKPPNYARTKKPSLFTVKPLYLHLDLHVEKHM